MDVVPLTTLRIRGIVFLCCDEPQGHGDYFAIFAWGAGGWLTTSDLRGTQAGGHMNGFLQTVRYKKGYMQTEVGNLPSREAWQLAVLCKSWLRLDGVRHLY